jgi:hypothetical protein
MDGENKKDIGFMAAQSFGFCMEEESFVFLEARVEHIEIALKRSLEAENKIQNESNLEKVISFLGVFFIGIGCDGIKNCILNSSLTGLDCIPISFLIVGIVITVLYHHNKSKIKNEQNSSIQEALNVIERVKQKNMEAKRYNNSQDKKMFLLPK